MSPPATAANSPTRSTGFLLRASLRTVAVLIAIAAVIDPSVTSERAGKAIVSVVPSDAVQDSALAARVAAALDEDFLVVRSPLVRADAMVLAGDRVRTDLDYAQPIFSVQSRANQLRIQALRAPTRAPLHAPVRVGARLFVPGTSTRSVVAELQVNGAVMDRQSLALTATQQHLVASMSFAATDTGRSTVRVVARAGADSAYADGLVAVHDRRYAVLVYDPRPTYSSTFVRRALERDPRLLVTSRIVTSRNISTSIGEPPVQLANASALSAYDAIVVGAPDALTARDVVGLESYLRNRGGSVVLLLDSQTRGPYQELVGVRGWSSRSIDGGAAARLNNGESDRLRVSTQFWPVALPRGATVLVRAAATRTDSLALGADAAPVIWRMAVGQGQLVVSGALDAWRYRDPDVSQFDRVFTQLVTDAAEATLPAISATVAQPVLAPSETSPVTVTMRGAMMAVANGDSLRANATAALLAVDSPGTVETPVGLSPNATPGSFVGALRAPSALGHAQLRIEANGDSAFVPIVVSDTRHHAIADEPALLNAWIASRGGWTIDESALGTLAGRLQGSLTAAPRSERWHPMRSAWWLLPFALCVSAEWWLRRRRGLP